MGNLQAIITIAAFVVFVSVISVTTLCDVFVTACGVSVCGMFVTWRLIAPYADGGKYGQQASVQVNLAA